MPSPLSGEEEEEEGLGICPEGTSTLSGDAARDRGREGTSTLSREEASDREGSPRTYDRSAWMWEGSIWRGTTKGECLGERTGTGEGVIKRGEGTLPGERRGEGGMGRGMGTLADGRRGTGVGWEGRRMGKGLGTG